MPGFDGTGPRGMGPMTGGGRGFCTGYAQSMGYPAYPAYGGYPVAPGAEWAWPGDAAAAEAAAWVAGAGSSDPSHGVN